MFDRFYIFLCSLEEDGVIAYSSISYVLWNGCTLGCCFDKRVSVFSYCDEMEVFRYKRYISSKKIKITSDNGPWQDLPPRIVDNGIRITDAGSTGAFRGCKASTYEGGFRVPAIVRWPDIVLKGEIIDDVTSSLDLFPTILRVAGVDIPKNLTLDGQYIWDGLTGKGDIASKPFFFVKADSLQAVRDEAWKCRITSKDGVELFNLADDSSEKFNIAKAHPGVVNRLTQEMKGFATDSGAKVCF
ncbi:sulfatase-like hydrolase/transferase [Halosquirtibacter laminarini]|uniref:Sulfatase-like hydrolase/transferase n=1 Tax=Halosquirtibacter laminarini TaxID=3374600 RepID=A0AC61NRD2_9BACT|nr:sulfatase-like hydrolase/transferase [Prolixibacteraceae bacterium]